MKKPIVAGFAGLIAISAAGALCRAAVLDFDNGGGDGLFLTAANWNDAIGSVDNTVPGPSDRAIINAGLVATYNTSATTTLGSLVVSADWPVTGDTGTPGTLNLANGKLIVTGGGDSFQIGRACCAGNGVINMSNGSELEIGGSDPIVGTRDRGVLDLGGTAWVHPTGTVENYWRLGNYGPSFDPTPANPGGLQGNGLLRVHGNARFNAHVIFIGDNDSTGALHVADNGSVSLTGNLVPRPSGFQAKGSATIEMSGSDATLQAFNLESESLAGEVPTKYIFNADSGGVSPITLIPRLNSGTGMLEGGAVNITNNDLIVHLNGFQAGVGGKILLFDAAPGQIYGTFASSTVLGSVVPHTVIYDNANGDIVLQQIPEPAAGMLLGLGVAIASTKRRRAV
jgi:hypothetical protein